MKKLAFYSLFFLVFACVKQKELSPVETAQIVVESFYTKDNATLKRHTTAGGYDGMIGIQNFVPDGNSKDSNFKVLETKIADDVAWVKFITSYDTKPETFKLIKQDGQWKVTQQAVREKGPF